MTKLLVEGPIPFTTRRVEHKLVVEDWSAMISSLSRLLPHLESLRINVYVGQASITSESATFDDTAWLTPLFKSRVPITLSYMYDTYEARRALRELDVKHWMQRYYNGLGRNTNTSESQEYHLSRHDRRKLCKAMLAEVEQMRVAPCKLEHHECFSFVRLEHWKGVCEACRAVVDGYRRE